MKISIPTYATKAIRLLEKHGFKAYAVGGCVRDSLLGKEPDDWDICTDCSPNDMKEVFKDYRTFDTGLKHGTLTVLIDNELLEITTFRSEGEYENHRKPSQIEFVDNLSCDLERRDFTVNAMCCREQDEIIDYYGGMKDLENRLLRCVGNPSLRFEEDALRILRALRFASVLDFNIHDDTKKAMYEKKQLLECISAERIATELKKLVCGKAVERVLLEYKDIFAVIIPEFKPCFGLEQNNPHHCYDVWTHIAKSVAYVRPQPLIRLAMLFHDIGKPKMATVDENGISHFKKHPAVSAQMTFAILTRLRFDNRSISYISKLITEHDNRIPADLKHVKRFIAKYDYQFMLDYLEIRRGDTYAQSQFKHAEKLAELDEIARLAIKVSEMETCLKISDLKINGNDLIYLGLNGKDIGNWLNRLLELVIDDVLINDKTELINYVKDNLE